MRAAVSDALNVRRSAVAGADDQLLLRSVCDAPSSAAPTRPAAFLLYTHDRGISHPRGYDRARAPVHARSRTIKRMTFRYLEDPIRGISQSRVSPRCRRVHACVRAYTLRKNDSMPLDDPSRLSLSPALFLFSARSVPPPALPPPSSFSPSRRPCPCGFPSERRAQRRSPFRIIRRRVSDTRAHAHACIFIKA